MPKGNSFLLAAVLACPVAALAIASNNESNSSLFERRCSGCHSLDKDKIGPRLRDVYGRTSGAVPGFNYSQALKKRRITWDEQSLDKWLADPDEFLPENEMSFQVIDKNERSRIIAYLKQVSGR